MAVVSFLVLVVSAAAAVLSVSPRLPDDTAPLSYDLRVSPDYGRLGDAAVGFDGEALIAIAARRNTAEITLNSRGLTVYVAYVHETTSKRAVDVTDVGYDEDNERLTIRLGAELRAGEQYTVDVEYRGTVGNGTGGLYASEYRVPDRE